MNKKKIIIYSLIVILIGLTIVKFFSFEFQVCLEIYLNNDVLLNIPKSGKEIYSRNREGEDFYILNYDNDNDIKKIIKKNNFEKITKDNLDEVIEALDRYHNDLCERELNLFDKTTNISKLAIIGNYYLYVENEENDDVYAVQIIFPKEKKLYHFFIDH